MDKSKRDFAEIIENTDETLRKQVYFFYFIRKFLEKSKFLFLLYILIIKILVKNKN